jgi:Mg2+-importing ATPase
LVHRLLQRPRGDRRRAGGRPAGVPVPIRVAAVFLAAVGVGLPLLPVGAAFGMTAPPGAFYPLLAAVLALYACALALARRRRTG